MMNLTTEQALAVNLEDTNIIVSAGAGSGKTAVLSERVIRKLKSGVDIRNILMLTFTNEAAGEMLDRIRKKIKKNNLVDQLVYLDQAYITTFDAFALNLVKKYHYYLNMSKNIKIIDSTIINLKKKEFLKEIFMEYYESRDPRFLKLIKDFTVRDDDVIIDAILSISSSLDLKYEKNEFLDNYINNYYTEEYINENFNEYFNYIYNLSIYLEDLTLSISSFMEESSYQKLYDSIKYLFRPNNYGDLYRYKDTTLGRFTKLDEDGISIKEEIKSTYQEIKELTFFSEEELKEYYKSTKDYVSIIIEIIKKLDIKINDYKKYYDSYEFSDIAKFAIKIVSDSEEIRSELKNKFNEIMIDEYQDTSDLQETFIKLIENKNVYMVGDIKQSIYRFRNANPLIFKNKYDLYSENKNGIKIDLLKNFRSRSEVLDNINLIFAPLMTKEVGGINYKKSHAMVYGNMDYSLSGKNEYDNDMDILMYNNEDKKYSTDEIEAFIIANDIKKKVSEKYLVYDAEEKNMREVNYSDFAIILDRGSKMGLFKKVFEYFNIPMELYKDSNLSEDTDILIIKNIIGLIMCIKNGVYNKEFRYYFYSVARSYVGNLSDKEIFACLENNQVFASLVYQKCRKLSLDLEYITPNILLKSIIEEFKFYDAFILVGNVDAAMKRMDYLLDLSRNVEDLGLSIPEFLDYLNTILEEKLEIKYKEAKSNSASVKLMNIHKSKGLEFPICYFALLDKKFNLRDLKNKFMYDNNYGILTPFYHDGVGETFKKTLVKNNYYQNEIAEKIRLFYVALTRAKEKIILVTPNIDIKAQSNEVSYIEALKSRSFYDFLSLISGNIKPYIKYVNLNDLGLTKDYQFNSVLKKNIEGEVIPIKFIDVKIDWEEKELKHASKEITDLISASDAKVLEYGTNMHEVLELTDFKNVSENEIVKDLKEKFDFSSAKIYQELEFIYEQSDKTYHGIIDLMLEYNDSIIIIDYKLKNIEDSAYIKQLSVYYDYISSISDKKISLYLYSILEKKIKEVIK